MHKGATVRVTLRLHTRGIYRPYNLLKCSAVLNSGTVSNSLAVSRDHSNTVRLKEKQEAKCSKEKVCSQMKCETAADPREQQSGISKRLELQRRQVSSLDGCYYTLGTISPMLSTPWGQKHILLPPSNRKQKHTSILKQRALGRNGS